MRSQTRVRSPQFPTAAPATAAPASACQPQDGEGVSHQTPTYNAAKLNLSPIRAQILRETLLPSLGAGSQKCSCGHEDIESPEIPCGGLLRSR